MTPELVALIISGAIALVLAVTLGLVLYGNRDSAKTRAIVARAEMQTERDAARRETGEAKTQLATTTRENGELLKRAEEAEAKYHAELAKRITTAPSGDHDAVHNGVLGPDEGGEGAGAAADPAAGRPAEVLRGPFPPRRPAAGDDPGGAGPVGTS